jgi:hypothetical protein
MAVCIPPLNPGPNKYGRLEFKNSQQAFPHSAWVDTLASVDQATTFGEQRDAVALAALSVGAAYYGLQVRRRGRLEPYIPGSNLTVRLDVTADQVSLASVKSSELVPDTFQWVDTLAGYQTPDPAHPHQAYAVVDVDRGREYHRVVADPSEALGEIEQGLGLAVVRGLASFLDGQYPGFDITTRLSQAGVTL